MKAGMVFEPSTNNLLVAKAAWNQILSINLTTSPPTVALWAGRPYNGASYTSTDGDRLTTAAIPGPVILGYDSAGQ